MFRRLFILVAAAVLMSVAVSAQPAPKQPPTEPVERTAADLEAIRQLETEAYRVAESMTPRDISHITFPTTIRVGITPYVNCSEWVFDDRPVTEVIEMDLRDYVKNVLPNEWVNTWPAEALRSGAVAVKMFAWWRINLTAQYPGVFRPEGVDVVDNTCDQVFFPNSHRPPTNAAVDFTWPYRLHWEERVQEIHFLAYDFQCADAQASQGGGWFRCLPQWTTKDMADQGASWQVMINQFYSPISISITSDILANTNVIRNGAFDLGTQNWSVLGGAQGAGVNGGVFSFYRGTTGGAAVLRQDIPVLVAGGSPLKLKIKLGNSSAVPKQVTVKLLRSDGGATARSCTFTIPPNVPLQKYTVWGTTPAAWSGLRVEVSGDSADNTPAYLVDGVNLSYRPLAAPATPCIPPLPGQPVIVTPAAGLTYGHDFTVVMTEGKTNHVAGYDAAFHIQIDDSSGFGSPVLDNGSNMAEEPSIDVSIPGGTWYLRARQFDGVDRYSGWTAAVRFTATNLPAMPALIAPVGDVPVDGQSFIWTATAQTDSYKVVVKRDGVTVYTAVVTPAQAACSSICVWPLGSPPAPWLTNTLYKWHVAAQNAEGKVKSTKSVFTLVATP